MSELRSMRLAAVAIALVLVGAVVALAVEGDDRVTTVGSTGPAEEAPPGSTAPATLAADPEGPASTAAPSPDPPATTSPPAADSSPSTTAPPPPEPALLLLGRSYRGATVTEAGQPRPLVDDTGISVRFERRDGGDSIAFSAGCNSMSARVTITADRLELGHGLGATAAGCNDEREQQDRWLASFFEAGPAWAIDGTTLTLTSGDTAVVLEESAPAA